MYAEIHNRKNRDNFSARDTLAVKGAAILLMMWHHLFGFPQYFHYDTMLPVNLAYYLGQFGKICVAIYLFLSGYGMSLSARSEDGSLWPSTIKRIRRFYTSYWLYFAICVPYGLFILQSGRMAPDVILFVKNLIGYIDYNNGYDVAWWFVSVYIPLLFLFPFLYKLSRSEPILLAMLMLGALGLQTRMWAGALPGSLFLWQSPFLMGILFARFDLFHSNLAEQIAGKRWWWHALVLSSLFLYRFRAQGQCTSDFVIAPIAVFSLSCLIKCWRLERPFVFLGELSLPLWLTHGFICFGYAHHIIYAPRYPLAIFAFLLVINIPLVWAIERFHQWAGGIVIGRSRVNC